MTTPIKFDKRLHDKNVKSGELSRDELTAYLDELPDLSDDYRHRTTEEESEETEATEDGTTEDSAGGEAASGASHEQG